MLSHDQMAFAITKLHPKLIHGKDFWVAHPIACGSSKQIGNAEIIEWPKELEKPDRKTLHKTFNVHADEFNTQQAKAIRLAKLKASDWTQLMDVAQAIRTPWATYRQALRDMPQQEGYPAQIIWPQSPAFERPEPPPAEHKPLPEKPPTHGRPPPPFNPPSATKNESRQQR